MRRYFHVLLYFILTILLLLPNLVSANSGEEERRFQEKNFTIINEVWRTPAKDQARTGTCWSFSTTSFLETELKRLGKGEYELSEMHTVFYAYQEKAKRYLRLWGKTQFGQGGLSHDVFYLIRKYGLVRDTDYSGLLPGEKYHDHRELSRALKGFLDGILDSREGPTYKWSEAFRSIVASYIGSVPRRISVNGQNVTPRQFAKKVLEVPFSEYIEFTSYSHMQFYSTCELLVPDNWMRYEKYFNVPLDDFIAIIDHALNNGYSVVFDLDVSEGTYNEDIGYAIVEQDNEGTLVTQAVREQLFNSHDTTDDHLEHVVGIAQDEEGNKFYLLKDSGGPDVGPFEGHTFVSENYVRSKVLAFMLHKDGIPIEIRTKLGIE